MPEVSNTAQLLVMEVVILAIRGESSHHSYPDVKPENYNTQDMVKHAHWHYSGTNIMGGINYFCLDLRPTSQIKTHSWNHY